jgi:hypothetical protein
MTGATLVLDAGALGPNRRLRIQSVDFTHRRDIFTVTIARDTSVMVTPHLNDSAFARGIDRVERTLSGSADGRALISPFTIRAL